MHRFIAALCLVATAVPALAADIGSMNFPPRRPGLWEMTVKAGPMTIASQTCVDRDTDHLLMLHSVKALNRMKGTMSVTGGGNHFQVLAVSAAAGHTITVTEDINYISDTAIKTTARTKYDPPIPSAAAMGMGEMTSDSKWVGSCPAGLQPGDAIINGRTVHLLKDTSTAQ